MPARLTFSLNPVDREIAELLVWRCRLPRRALVRLHVLLLTDGNAMSTAEVSSMLGVSQWTVYNIWKKYKKRESIADVAAAHVGRTT